MLITEFNELDKKGKKKKDPQKVIKTGGHCYDGCGWNTCDFWWIDKNDQSRCALFGNAVKWKSEALKICDKMYGYHYEDRA